MPAHSQAFTQSRHADDGRYLHALAGEVWAKCVRCHLPGLVTAQWDGWHWHATFDCVGCDLKLDSERGDWVGEVVLSGRRPCGYCGHQWLRPRIRQVGWPREVITTVNVECAACHRSSAVDLEQQPAADIADCRDPHFGMPLWLVDSGRHGALWAYNAAHLQVLKSYVCATLRERGPASGNASLLSRLPAWIKAAKNRAAITKRLERLERQLAEASRV